MKTVSYCTALYSKQAYCQKERVDAFNEAHKEALKQGIEVHVQTLINNSPRSFLKEMVRMYMRYADFPHLLVDYGKIKYTTEFEQRDYDWTLVDGEGREVEVEDDSVQMYRVRHFDIYRLLAHMFNIGIDYAVEKNFDFFGILSGDQILPPEHPATLVNFLQEHPQAGLVSALAFYDFSKKEIVCKGKVKEYMIPLIIFRQRPGETREQMEQREAWTYANLLPHPENNYTGLEYCEVDACGTGGCLVSRKVFSQLKFDERPYAETGEGEDIQYCVDIKNKLGLKCYVAPTVVIKNRYADGQFY